MTADALDVYAIACLGGGTERVVDTALVALVESGRLRVSSPGELAMVSLVHGHPVEAAVLDAIGPAGRCPVEAVRWRLMTDDRILDVARRLRDAGLVEAGGRTPAARRSRWRLAPTYAGLHLLHELHEVPPADDATGNAMIGNAMTGSALTVALHGWERMPDRGLRAAIFDPPPPAAADAVDGRHPAPA